MANRDAEPEITKTQYSSEYTDAEKDKLFAIVADLKDEFNNLHAEFIKHDHTSASTYTEATVKVNVAADTVINTTASHTFVSAAITAAVPQRWD